MLRKVWLNGCEFWYFVVCGLLCFSGVWGCLQLCIALVVLGLGLLMCCLPVGVDCLPLVIFVADWFARLLCGCGVDWILFGLLRLLWVCWFCCLYCL